MLDLDRGGDDEHRHRVAVVGRVGHVLRLVAEREVGDVGDRAYRFVDPMHVHAGTGAYLRSRARVDRMEQRGVGAVELDQRPCERPIERLAFQRCGLP